MADQPDLAVVVEDLLALSLGPRLILAVVLSELLLPLFFGLGGRAAVLLELLLRLPACLLMVAAGRRAEGTQPRGRLDLVGALVGHHDRNTKRPGSERCDGDFPDQLLDLERRCTARGDLATLRGPCATPRSTPRAARRAAPG